MDRNKEAKRLRSLTKGSQKRPPFASAPASEVARSPNRERRRSTELAQLAFPRKITALWAQPERAAGEIIELDSLASCTISNIFVRGPQMARSLSWHAFPGPIYAFAGVFGKVGQKCGHPGVNCQGDTRLPLQRRTWAFCPPPGPYLFVQGRVHPVAHVCGHLRARNLLRGARMDNIVRVQHIRRGASEPEGPAIGSSEPREHQGRLDLSSDTSGVTPPVGESEGTNISSAM